VFQKVFHKVNFLPAPSYDLANEGHGRHQPYYILDRPRYSNSDNYTSIVSTHRTLVDRLGEAGVYRVVDDINI